MCAAGACKVLFKRGSCILMYALVTIDPSRTGEMRAVFGNPSCSVLTRRKAARSATSDDSRSRNVVKRYSLPFTIIPPIHRCQGKRRCKVLRVICCASLSRTHLPYLTLTLEHGLTSECEGLTFGNTRQSGKSLCIASEEWRLSASIRHLRSIASLVPA